MIKITRIECPDILSNDGDIDNPRCKEAVVEDLHTMQHGKCCYCEKKIDQSGHGQALEHFRPRASNKYPELKNTWSNLLHSCADCNGKKWHHFPTDINGNPLIIDPSDPNIDPEDYLDFCVDDENDLVFGAIRPKLDSESADNTIEIIGLDLPFRRYERVSGYKDLFTAYMDIKNASDPIEKQQKIRAVEGLLGANNKYAAFARAFARYKRLDSRFGVRIPVGAEV